MSFDWTHFLDVARDLADNSDLDTEARLRSAVSRAYYAAFNHARTYLTSRGVTFFREFGDHERVLEQLRSHGHTDLADELYRMRRWRNRADYDTGHSDFRLMWIGSNAGAQAIIDSLTPSD